MFSIFTFSYLSKIHQHIVKKISTTPRNHGLTLYASLGQTLMENQKRNIICMMLQQRWSFMAFESNFCQPKTFKNFIENTIQIPKETLIFMKWRSSLLKCTSDLHSSMTRFLSSKKWVSYILIFYLNYLKRFKSVNVMSKYILHFEKEMVLIFRWIWCVLRWKT